MAIDERPDGQMLMTIAFVLGCFVTGILAIIICVWIASEDCPKLDCTQQVQELQNTVKRQENTIKRLEVYEQAVKWGKK